MSAPEPVVAVEPDAEQLARAVATALVDRLASAQAEHGWATVVLTGGGIGIAVLEQVAALTTGPVPSALDWTRVHVWWGDERFVPADDAERNERGARTALLDRVGVPAAQVHAMPASDGPFDSPEQAAGWYSGQLSAAAPENGSLPRFDVLLLGIGEEGHVASIFPDSPAARAEEPVVAVRDCPKPPPTRVSLGFTAINHADEVWLLVSGGGKAWAVARGVPGAPPTELPAGAAHGRTATIWWLDRAAAADLPGQDT